MRIARPYSVRLRNQVNKKLDRSIEKLVSSRRINTASDDAATLAISEGLKAQKRGAIQAARNVQDGLSLLQTAEGGLGNIEENLQRMRVLAVQGQSSTLASEDRAKLTDELHQLVTGIDDIAENTTFNGMKLLRTSLAPLPVGMQKADIVFVVDNTGSMLSLQADVRDSLLNMLNKIKAQGVSDIRVGLLEYRDTTFNQMNFPSGKWTDKSNEIIQGFNNVIGTNSGNTENTMRALQESLNRYDFRQNAAGTRQRHIIVVTDEGADDAGLMGAVLPQLEGQGISVHAVYNFNRGASEYNELVKKTGGESMDISQSLWKQQVGPLFGNSIGQASAFRESAMPGLLLQVGPDAEDLYQIDLYDVRSSKLGVNSLSLTSPEQAALALGAIDKALTEVSRQRAEYGGHMNSLEHVQNLLTISEVEMAAAESVMVDVDMPCALMELTKQQMLAEVSRTFSAQVQRISRDMMLSLLGE